MPSKLLSTALAVILYFTLSVTTYAQHSDNEHAHDAEHHATEHAEHDSHGHSNISEKEEITEIIKHHLLDAHEFHITPGVTIPLPVILVDEGVQFFMSSAFHHGHSLAESNGKSYMEYHGKIYRIENNEVPVSKKFTLKVENAAGEKVDSSYVEQIAVIPAETFIHNYVTGHGILAMDTEEGAFVSAAKPLDLSITKSVTGIILMFILLTVLMSGAAKTYSKGPIPTGFGRFLEPLVIFVRDEIAIPNIGEKHYKRYMNYLLTIFFFVWFMNLAGMLPLGLNVTGNIAVTFALAILTFIITQFTANKNYWGHIFWMPGVPTPMKIILAPIELLGVFIKPFALMIRLYANIKAGHVVLMSLISLMFLFKNVFAQGAFFGLTFLLSLLELLVAALQAYIFTMLSALYFGAAVEEHDHH